MRARQSPDWRFAGRHYGDWHSRDSRPALLNVGLLYTRRRKGDLPEHGKWFVEFEGNQIPLGTLARGAGDARAGAFPGAVIDDLDLGLGIHRIRANNHCAMDIYGDCIS